MKLTPQQKQYKSDLLDITRAKNRALAALSFHTISTWEDFLHSIGHNRSVLRCYYHNQSRLDKPATRPEILEFFAAIETLLSQKELRDAPKWEFTPHEYEGVYYDGNNAITKLPENIVDPTNIVVGDALTAAETLPPSSKQKCSLFPFQERAATTMLHNIIHAHMHGQLLRAGVGLGKTFIIGAVLRRLLDMKFCDGKTYSPWPIVYVTKATIIEQTERVLRDLFGIDIVNEVKVINIEQLRASFGELMVRSETVVVRGEEEIKWVWRQGVHPIIFLFDECQILKNDSSQQSQIAQSIAEIDHPDIYCLFFSATPFMRVEECKAFVLNCRLDMHNLIC